MLTFKTKHDEMWIVILIVASSTYPPIYRMSDWEVRLPLQLRPRMPESKRAEGVRWIRSLDALSQYYDDCQGCFVKINLFLINTYFQMIFEFLASVTLINSVQLVMSPKRKGKMRSLLNLGRYVLISFFHDKWALAGSLVLLRVTKSDFC